MADFVNTIDLLGDEAVTKALVERTITEFTKNAFYCHPSLQSVNFPNATVINEYAFYSSALVSVNAPKVTSANISAFHYCSALTSVNLPNLWGVPQNGFSRCNALTKITLPNVTSLGINAFNGCSALEIADFPTLQRTQSSSFSGCSKLSVLILRSETIAGLGNSNTLSGTPFASGKAGGTLIVPRSLTTEYPNATNWSAVFANNANNRILALEDYTVDGTITGEIDWDKLLGGTT